MNNNIAQQIMYNVQDVTDHVYHSLLLFEQLFARLEARCVALDGKASIEHGKTTFLSSHAHAEPTYGVIAPLLADNSVNDILINGAHQIYVERSGILELTDLSFDSEEQLAELAQQIGTFCGREISPLTPLVDARLPDGSRVNIVIPPVAIDGISISIRKFSGEAISLDAMAKSGNMSIELAEFLRCAAKANVNIIVSGGTGAGKTTLLNALCKHISDKERVVTIEDSAELKLPIPHVVRLESITHAQEGRAMVSIRDLVKNALRMRPNRIIVGEVRGAEAFDMIQAMNTGHDGSLTTIHANTPRDAVARLENMIGMCGMNLPTIAIRRQIASAVHLIVQAERTSEGHRRISRVTEIVGIEGDMITMQDVFVYKEEKNATPDAPVRGTHQWSGVFPRHAKLNQLLRASGMMKA
jgi:pilus assembly protein CpaF